MPAWTCAAALRKISKDLCPNGSDSRAAVGDLHLLGCRDLQHFGTKCVIWCYKFMNKCPRTAKEWRNMHLTKPEVRWDKKEKLPNKNQPSNCNVQKVLFRMWPRGHKKLGSLPDCGRRLAFWERSFFAAQNCYCRHAKNGSMSWVLGHGPIRPNTMRLGVLGMFWRSKYILSLRRCLDV